MSARGMPSGSTGRPAKRAVSIDLVRSANPATLKSAEPVRLSKPNPQPTNGDTVFDAEAFLAKAGVGKKILSLKKE
jgi:hypothetical protein